jgi:Spy/CpxP family protein refolding chaperone
MNIQNGKVFTERILHFLLFLLFLVLLIPLVYAADSGYHRHMGMGSMGDRMGMNQMEMGHMGMGYNDFHTLDLSAKQRKTLRDMERNNRAKRWAIKDKIAEYRDQLYTLYKQEKPDPKKIGEVYQKILELRRQLVENRIELRNQQYDVLTKEQKEKLKTWRPRGMGYHRDRDDYHRGMHHMWR